MTDIKRIIEGILSQGRMMGSRSGSAGRKLSRSGHPGDAHGLRVGASRNYGQEKFVVNRDAEEKEKREKLVKTRTKESEARARKLSMTAKKQMNETTNSEKREKIKSVARPDDPKPTDSGLLYKQAQIKTKIIDEDKVMSINFGLSKDLIAAVRTVMEKKEDDTKNIGKGKTEVDLKPKTDDDINDDGSEKMSKKCPICKKSPCKCGTMKEEKELSPKQKKIAAMAGDPKKIDAEDLKKLRSSKTNKEVEELDELKLGSYINYMKAAEKDKLKNNSKIGQHVVFKSKDTAGLEKLVNHTAKRSKGMDTAHRRITAKLNAEDVEELDEISKKTLGSYVKKASDDAARHAYMSGKKDGDLEHAAKATKRYRGVIKATDRLTKEDLDSLTEEQLEEVLKKSDPAGKWISDFVHSKDPEFAGKSKKERMKQALGAYYAKQRNEEVTFSQAELDRIEEIAKQLG
jgi:hypothetical protein